MDATTPAGPRQGDLYRCVHCGLCLEHCPTYRETGLELESPRGRIALMRALYEGRLRMTPAVVGHWGLCLQCRACEAACPSGVPFGRMMEATRAQLHGPGRDGPCARLVRWLLFRQLLPHQRRLEWLAGLLRLYQRSRLQSLVRASHVLRLAPSLARAEAALPSLPPRFFSPTRPLGGTGGQHAGSRGTVALFTGCVMPLLYGRVHEATVRVLQRVGFTVVVPPGQLCCGALNVHAGEREAAREMARQNVEVFLGAGVGAVVANAAGCGAHLKGYAELLEGAPADAERARRFSAAVLDLSEVLEGTFLPPLGEVRERAVYQEPCHLVHAQRIRAAPRRLLGAIPGLELAEMAESDVCCGAAGSYSLAQPGMARRLLERKLEHIRAAAPTVVVSANPGCMLQLEQGLRRAGLGTPVVHFIELLDRALQAHDPG